MYQSLSLKRLNQTGIHHILMPVIVFILLFGIAGSYFLLKSQAAPWSGALEIGSRTSGYCMDVQGSVYTSGTPVVLNKCNNKVDQKWELASAGSFQKHSAFVVETYQAGKFMCVDNWQQSNTNGNGLRLYPCNGVDPAERFVWTWVNGNVNNLYNVQTGRCIDDPQGSTKANNQLDLYKCKTTSNWNQMWFEVSNPASASSTPVSTGTPTASTTSTTPPPTDKVSGIALQLASDRKVCMNNMDNSNTANTTVDLSTCSNTPSESWALTPVPNQSNRFQIIAKTSNACVVDPNGTVGTNPSNRVFLFTVPCNSSDKTQVWMWSGAGGSHELRNASSTGGCINDPANDKDPGTRLIAFSCSTNATNEQWYEAAL
jgi:hypothetical protein